MMTESSHYFQMWQKLRAQDLYDFLEILGGLFYTHLHPWFGADELVASALQLIIAVHNEGVLLCCNTKYASKVGATALMFSTLLGAKDWQNEFWLKLLEVNKYAKNVIKLMYINSLVIRWIKILNVLLYWFVCFHPWAQMLWFGLTRANMRMYWFFEKHIFVNFN
jgi:hypothetical protein